ncbi:MAG: hypothetical protein Kow0063_10140 [Anaerolineae bacterium]
MEYHRSGILTWWKIRFILVICLLASGLPAPLLHAAPPRQSELVRDLWLDVSLGPPLVGWFNRVARPEDIARVEHVQQINLLDEITTGRKLVVFRSIREAEQALPHIADRIDIVGYNLEMGPNNLSAEQADPVGSVRRMHDLARRYDLLLAFGPDHDLALSDGVEVAPYVDIFVLQVQRVQTEPATVFDFVLPLIPELRQANPDLEISVQVRTEGDVVEVVDLIDAISEQLDGVSILTSPETIEVAEALVDELRSRQDAIASPSALLATPGIEAETGTPTPPLSEMGEETRLSCPLMVVGALIAGGVGGGVTAALICASRKGTDRPTSRQL